MARTFAVIAPVQLILHKVSCSNEMISNETKHYEPDQNMGLGSNGVDRVRSLWKIPTRLRGTNFCINCTSSARFAPSFMHQQNNPKCTQTIWNRRKHELRLQWGASGAFFVKIPTRLRGTNFCINCTSSARFAPSFMQQRNDPKCTQTLWNRRKHELSLQWGGSGAFVVKNSDTPSWHKLLH